MKLSFRESPAPRELRKPEAARVPSLPLAEVAALYQAARVGGDFYDFIALDHGSVFFVLLDIAGDRAEAFHIAAEAQQMLRQRVPEILGDGGSNQSEGVSQILIELNREIMRAAGGVRCSPTFLGCYNQQIGVLQYCNAGHTAALLKDANGVVLLEATGLPLGLFSHATHDAQFRVLEPGALLALVSKGLVECRSGSHEFGLERVRELLAANQFSSAQQCCQALLAAAVQWTMRSTPRLILPSSERRQINDITALALWRSAAAAVAVPSS
jgi:serine phosphatase RsbU (regulator of sigma subunit)